MPYYSANSRFVFFFQKIGILLFTLFAFSLPFPMEYSYCVLAALAIYVVINFKIQTKKRIPKEVFIFQLVYWLSLSGYLYSDDTFRANYMLERQLTIFIFPLLMPLVTDFSKNYSSKILLGLALGSIVAIFFLYYKAFESIVYINHASFFQKITTDPYLNQNFALPLSIHSGYLSIFISMSIIFLLDYLRKLNNRPYIVVLFVIALIILIMGLLSLASRNTIITTVFIIIIVYPFFYVKRRALYFLVTISVCAAVFYFLKQSPYFESRFSSEFVQEMSIKKVKLKDEYQVEPRMQRWICAANLIKQQPIFGYGTGDEVELLKKEYLKNNLIVSYNLEFNAHNQYISTLIKHGIVGLVLFLFAFVYYLYLGVQNTNFIYTSFTILLLVGFFTENILDMNKGIFFFAFFNTLFAYQILYEKREKALQLKNT